MTESSDSSTVAKKHSYLLVEEYIYLLVEEYKDNTHISAHTNTHKLCIKATTWVDSFYKENKLDYPRKLPGIEEIQSILKPLGIRNSYVFHEDKNLKYKVYIKRVFLHK